MQQSNLYPLILSPTVKNYIWGGQKLAHLVDKAQGQVIAEVWAVYGENKIKNGKYAGLSLDELLLQQPADLLGWHYLNANAEKFPVLIKILDSRQWLSIQVHPDDRLAAELEGEQFNGKTEAWYFLNADTGAQIYAGSKGGVTDDELVRAIQNGSILDVLQVHPITSGGVIFIEAGTIHALGPGLLVYELQQNSDLTYRVYDWGRPATAGRALHIENSVAAAKNRQVSVAQAANQVPADAPQQLAECPYFKLERLENRQGWAEMDTQLRSFHALTVAEGEMALIWEDMRLDLGQYETVLVPAGLGKYRLFGEFRALRASAGEMAVG